MYLLIVEVRDLFFVDFLESWNEIFKLHGSRPYLPTSYVAINKNGLLFLNLMSDTSSNCNKCYNLAVSSTTFPRLNVLPVRWQMENHVLTKRLRNLAGVVNSAM